MVSVQSIFDKLIVALELRHHTVRTSRLENLTKFLTKVDLEKKI